MQSELSTIAPMYWVSGLSTPMRVSGSSKPEKRGYPRPAPLELMFCRPALCMNATIRSYAPTACAFVQAERIRRDERLLHRGERLDVIREGLVQRLDIFIAPRLAVATSGSRVLGHTAGRDRQADSADARAIIDRLIPCLPDRASLR